MSTKQKPKPTLGIRHIVLLAGIALVVGALWVVAAYGRDAFASVWTNIEFLRGAATADGTVERYVCSRDDQSRECSATDAMRWVGDVYPIVRFQDKAGRDEFAIFRNSILAPAPRAADYPLGKQMDVLYDPKNPIESYIADRLFWDFWLMPGIFVLMFFLELGVVAVFARFLWRYIRKEIRGE
jgi:hypothetical protein